MFFYIFSLFLYTSEPPFFVSKALDIDSLKKLTQNDVVIITRRCRDLEGRENYLSISSVRIKGNKENVMNIFKDNQRIKQALPDVKDVKVVKKYSDREYDVEYDISLKIFGGIKISVKYLSHVVVGDNYIYSYIKDGKNRGGWRITEFFEDNGSTVVVLSMCEFVRVAPIANEIFSANPHFEVGIISSTGLITLTQFKKYIERVQ
ncbi:MAG: hypothetical protein NZ927_03755 [Candidatus Calescibacterium sp.]|nr:hypothetical protein [Candidatus Calescibacterium sp.]MCX7733503.1 hypothetical protein [bacterium]MDW8087216.1 hypothetical protein [Candidatus Calescibacterium sp.]